jgi:hypothetical protein
MLLLRIDLLRMGEWMGEWKLEFNDWV